MTDEQILKLAIEKAVKNGFDIKGREFDSASEYCTWGNIYYPIIFDHEFAKAFWGEDEVKVFEREINDFGDWFPKRWEFHLTKLILEKEPLKYIEQYLTPKK